MTEEQHQLMCSLFGNMLECAPEQLRILQTAMWCVTWSKGSMEQAQEALEEVYTDHNTEAGL